MTASKRYRWRGIGRKVLLVLIIVVLGGIFLFGRRGLLQWYRLHRLEQTMESSNDSLAVETQELSRRIEALEEGDSLELERAARHWGMVRSGEEVYVVREESDTLQTLP